MFTSIRANLWVSVAEKSFPLCRRLRSEVWRGAHGIAEPLELMTKLSSLFRLEPYLNCLGQAEHANT